MKFHRKHSGFTLVELMIAMVLGLFILVGIMQISISSKKTYQVANYSAVLQEDLRTVTNEVSRIVRMAGYKTSPWISTTNSFQIDATFEEDGQVLIGTDGATNSDSDSISLRFQGSGDGAGNPDGDVVDCVGNALDANDITTIKLEIIKERRMLRCTSINETQGDEQSVDLVENIENMQLLYGIDTDNDLYANEYITATAVTNRALWVNVVSMRLALLLKSTREIVGFENKKDITLNDLIVPATNDHYMRMQSTATIAVRNIVP